MSVNQTIKDVGISATVIRAGGNVSTSVYVYPKIKQAAYERDGLMPTDSGVVSGDLITASGVNYLVKAVLIDERVGQTFLYRVKLYACNHTITIKAYSGGTFVDAATNVPCLIADSTAVSMSDRGVVVPSYAGKDSLYYLYVQAGAGVTRNSLLVDGAGNTLRVAGDINPYFADGLAEVRVKVE